MKKYILLVIIGSLLASCVKKDITTIDDECTIIGKKTEIIDCTINKNCINVYAEIDRSTCGEDDTGMMICAPRKQIGCRKLTEYEIKKEQSLTDICKKTGGIWGTSPSQPRTKHCICERTYEKIMYIDNDYKKYQLYKVDGTLENFNEKDGCVSIKKLCELMGGIWEYNKSYKFWDICRINQKILQYYNGEWSENIYY